MDLFEQARQKINQGLIQSIYPNGKSELDEYYILSPLRNDKNIGSFHINLNSGYWVDHATSEGGDFIDLISKDKKISKKEAAELIIDDKTINKPIQPRKKIKEKPNHQAMVIEQTEERKKQLINFVSSDFFKEKFGKVADIWDYINSRNEWKFSTVKFSKKDGSKDIIPFYLNEYNKWKSAGAVNAIGVPEPFNINKVEKGDKILIVEGEKCASCKVEGYTLVSWWGGTQRVDKTDWSGLEKIKDIIIWPDHDKQRDKVNNNLFPKRKQPGFKAALQIQNILPQAKILNIYRWGIDETIKNGWDIADHIEEGKDPLDFIKEYKPRDFISPKIIKEMFIDDFYCGGLKQFNGFFWEYISKKKYWKGISLKDLYCNLQYWLDDTGLQEDIERDTCGKDNKFISNVEAYLKRHRRKIEDNPFLKAAINPFINMRNGVIEIIHDKFKWHPVKEKDELFFKDLHMVNVLDFDFDFKNRDKVSPEKDCPVFYKFIKDAIPKEYLIDNDPNEAYKECLDFVTQILAYTVSPIKKRPLFFGIIGEQETGKTFLVKIVKEFIGKEFTVDVPMKEWSNRFFAHSLLGAKAIVEPDMKQSEKIPENIIKMYSGDVTVSIEGKNRDSEHGVDMSLAIFIVSNYSFRTSALEGLERRLVLFPFKNKLSKEDTDDFMLERMVGKHVNYSGITKDERPAIMALVLRAWIKLCSNKFHIDSPEWSKCEKKKWVLESNTVKNFINDRYTKMATEEIINKKDFYNTYNLWCIEEGHDFPFKKNRFFEEVFRDRRFVLKRNSITNNIHIEPDKTNEDIPF
ncbi:MAG: DUF5906 domain-containing protein [Candidatus Helarchaeota archaeon]